MIGGCFLVNILKGRTDVTSILSPYLFLNLKYHTFVFIDLGTPLKFGPVPINFKGIVNLIFLFLFVFKQKYSLEYRKRSTNGVLDLH